MARRAHATRFAIALSALLAGCSLLVDTSERVQCASNADCEANPLFQGRLCTLGFCERPPRITTPVSNEGGEACISTELCTQKNSGRASKCLVKGTPCVDWVIDDECPTITGPWKDDNAIIVGALMPFTLLQKSGKRQDVAYTTRLQRALDLAVFELEEQNPIGFQIGSAQRPVAVLFCDSRGAPDTARAYFDHLTEVAGAKAVIVAWDDDLAAVAAKAAERKTAIVCSDCLTPLPAGPAAWRILPPITLDARLAAWRVSDLEAKIKAVDASPIRVALVFDDVVVGKAFAAELQARLTFNGTNAEANRVANAFKVISLEDPRSGPAPHDLYAEQIAAFAPHVVVAGSGPGFSQYVLKAIEDKLAPAAPRPAYVVTQMSFELAQFQVLLDANDGLRTRISGTFPRVTPERAANIAKFESEYRREYKSAADGTYSGYEAFYSMAFAIAAAIPKNHPLAPFDGTFIGSGFGNLTSGQTVDFRADNIKTGLGFISGGGSRANPGSPIDVRGLTTELAWKATGELDAEMGMFCFGRGASNELVLRHDPNVVYSPATDQVTGTYTCE
jgi:ABC-type branched-subunit amino acid transport system substrate-binding protein